MFSKRPLSNQNSKKLTGEAIYRAIFGTLLAGNIFIAIPTSAYDAGALSERLTARARQLYAAAKYRACVSVASQAITVSPQIPDAYALRGMALRRDEKFAEAITDLDRAIGMEEKSNKNGAYTIELSNMHFCRGDCYMEKGDKQAALADYNACLQIWGQNSAAYLRRSQLKYLLNDYAGALKDADKLVSLKPAEAFKYDNRAKVLYALGQYPKVVADLSEAIKLNPAEMRYYGSRARAYEKMHLYREAAADNKKIKEASSMFD